MQAIFEILECIDDAGVATYEARLGGDVDDNGRIDRSAPFGIGDTAWDAILQLIWKLDGVDFAPMLFSKEAR